MKAQYKQPTIEQRQNLLKIAGESDRLVKDQERKKLTTISRSKTWQMEREGTHPKRCVLGNNSVAWVLSDLLHFIYCLSEDNANDK